MDATIAALYRHPVKGFTPEPLAAAVLEAGACFPCDRLFAVEDGPSGFDPVAPEHISKIKFTVLAKIPAVARAHTAYDEASGVFSAKAEGQARLRGRPARSDGGRAGLRGLADRRFWPATIKGPLRVIEGPGAHRFMDSKLGLCLDRQPGQRAGSVGQRIGRDLDPLRFRANLYVEGWPAWAENDLDRPGPCAWAARPRPKSSSPSSAAPPLTWIPRAAERDVELVKALFDHYSHMFCGIYRERDGRAARWREGDGVAVS